MSIKPIAVNNTELLFIAAQSKLNKSIVVGDSTVDVYSIKGFSANQPLLIGNFGSEGAEIINAHATTSPIGDTITLASALLKDHNQDTEIFSLLYDQVELSHADTITGTKTVLSTTEINPEEENFILTDTTATGGYYFIRYYNSISTDYSEYADAIPYEGLDPNTVGAVIGEVLEDMHAALSTKLTQTMLINALNRMLRKVRGRVNKWSNFQKFDHILGKVEYGKNAYDLPTDIYTKDTNRCVSKIRISSKRPMKYIDKEQYDVVMREQNHTQIATAAIIGQVTLVLDSTGDLDDAGTVYVFVDDTRYAITYTANDKDTNTLSGVPATGDGSITVALPVDSDVWDNETYADPRYYTVFDEQIHIPYVAPDDLIGKNIYIDYWTDIETVDSDSDVLTMPRYDMAYYYLKAYVRAQLENNGVMDSDDPDYIEYQQALAEAQRKEHTGQRRRRAPRMNGIFYSNSNNHLRK